MICRIINLIFIGWIWSFCKQQLIFWYLYLFKPGKLVDIDLIFLFRSYYLHFMLCIAVETITIFGSQSSRWNHWFIWIHMHFFQKAKRDNFLASSVFLIAFNKHTNTSFHKRGESEPQSWVVNEQSSSELTLLQTRLIVQLFSEGAPRHSIKYKYYTDCLQLFSQIKRIQHDAVVISGFSLVK